MYVKMAFYFLLELAEQDVFNNAIEGHLALLEILLVIQFVFQQYPERLIEIARAAETAYGQSAPVHQSSMVAYIPPGWTISSVRRNGVVRLTVYCNIPS